jgi:hypothetical protein
MIEDSALEKMLRDKINKEKINFPEKLDEKIKTVIRELPERKEKVFPWKAAMTAASIALILTTSVILFRGTIKDNLLAVTNHPQARNKIVVVSNQELINKFKSEGYIVENNIGDIDKMQGGYSLADRVRCYVNLEELVDSSDIIIEGEVLAVRYFDDNNHYTYTVSKVRVTKSYNNKVSTGEVVTFVESGGFTTQYNMILRSGAKEKFGEKYYEICKTTPEEEEKTKNDKVFSYSFDGGTIMQPSDKVILFGQQSTDSLIDGANYYPVGGFEGKFIIKENTAERIIPKSQEGTPSFKMSTIELSSKLTDIIKNNRTAVNVPKVSANGISTITIKRNLDGNKQKVITKKEDIERIINHINSIEYKYSSDLDWSSEGYTIEFKGDKEYFIGFNGMRLKYNDRWYTVKHEDLAKVGIELDTLYNSMNYKEETK